MKKYNKKGFTLAEVLMVVAILAILFALAIPALSSIQKSLRQKELDSKAETIYTAVQNRLSELYTSGQSDLYDPSGDNASYIHKLGYIPSDYDLETLLGNNSVYYISSSDSDFIKDFLGEQCLSEDLYNGHFIIEIIPYYFDEDDDTKKYSLTAASVYAVYYSEDVIDVTDSTQYPASIDGSEFGNSNSYYTKRYRDSRTSRKNLSDARVGYYSGSSLAGGSSTNAIKVNYIKINSNELVNTAEVRIKKSASISSNAVFKFEFKDTLGNTRTYFYEQTGATAYSYIFYTYDDANGKVNVKPSDIGLTITPSGSIYKFVFTLDDLSKDSTRFNSLFGSESNSKFKGKLVPGLDISLNVEAYCILGDGKTIDGTVSKGEASAYGNSIYAYVDSDKNLLESDSKAGFNITDKSTAYISNGRHLQNLDEGSGVVLSSASSKSSYISSAVLLNDLSFSTDSEFYSKYIKNYYNGIAKVGIINANGNVTYANIPNFKAITNPCLRSFDASYEKISETGLKTSGIYTIYNFSTNSSSNNGLFSNISNNLTISNLKLVGTTITSDNNVGSLIGYIGSNATVNIKNVSVYLSSTNGDIPTVISSEDNIESYRWLEGNVTGGLVGTNAGTLNIDSSFASTVLGKDTGVTGGLVGENKGTLTISKAYADSYLYGTTVGGLVGQANSGTISIDNSYAVGFVGLNKGGTAAGLVNGSVNLVNYAYSALSCYNLADDKGIDRNNGFETTNTFYSTAKSISNYSRLYYAYQSVNAGSNYDFGISGVENVNIGGSFTNTSSLASVPYKLLGLSLSTYPYPRIIGLDQYGDWDATFAEGSLVYYEYYADGTYGFDGANVDVTLSNNSAILGDGYGFIFKDDGHIPSSFTYKVGNSSKTISTNSFANKISVKTDKGNYVIFPLTVSETNPTSVSNYYTNVSISYSNNDTKYFIFNPHFASTVKTATSFNTTTAIPDDLTVSIRSPRHLNNLSKYYSSYGTILGSSITYKQNRDINYATYNWSTYAGINTVSSQSPIGVDKNNGFKGIYDGGSYKIESISFVSNDGYYIGLFGYVSNGSSIKNVVLVSQYLENGTNYFAKRYKGGQINEYVNIGILVGYNNGTIDNCAVAGYYLGGNNKIYGYANSTTYVGGLVGYNDDKGTITNCSADLPEISLSMYQAISYNGGFVGYNKGNITNCYAINHLDASAYGGSGSTYISGFAGFNSGRINSSYCATALTSEGDDAHTYMFAPIGNGGQVSSDSYYLSQGSYLYVDNLYSYNGSTATSGTGKKYSELVSYGKLSKATSSSYNQITVNLIKENSNSTDYNYPFKAVVKDRNKNLVHYGEWLVSPSLGDFGMFYWEHEVGGTNEGYHITYIGHDSNNNIQYKTTICEAHDDGGTVVEFGYGYYVLKGAEEGDNEVQLIVNSDIEYSGKNKLNINAKTELESQLENFTLYPFTTRLTDDKSDENDTSYLYLTGSDINGSITLKFTNSKDESKDKEATYYISPFYANALLMVDSNADSYSGDVRKYLTNSSSFTRDALSSTSAYVLGSSNHPYEIRSIRQLEYINWNSATNSTSNLVSKDNYTTYNYLIYDQYNSISSDENITVVTETNAGNANNRYLNFDISHDLSAEWAYNNTTTIIDDYVPIAGQSTSTLSATKYNSMLPTWFGSTFDGHSYKIQNLNIASNSFTVGLFGVTAGANLNNIILYSKNGDNFICRGLYTDSNKKVWGSATTSNGSYSLGGLVGVAYDYGTGDSFKNTTKVINNCSIGGYLIVDNSTNTLTLGEANVGGLVGISNTLINNCSAVVDIKINATHTSGHARYGDFIRVGGIAGAAPNNVNNCYTGGSISVGKATLNENYSQNNNQLSYYDATDGTLKYYSSSGNLWKINSTHVYLSGVVGCGFAMNYSNFSGSSSFREGNPSVTNSYTYIEFPTMEGTIRSISMITSYADRANNTGTTNLTINNCYYLANSANITYNLPTFVIQDENGTATSSPANAYNMSKWNGEKYIDGMLLGKSNWLLLTMSDSNNYSNNNYDKISNDPIKKTYNDLTTISDLLNNGNSSSANKLWKSVSNTDSQGNVVNGRYSFPAGISSLANKDYPFPTIITQSEDDRTVNVHYGRWGIDGPYFEDGIVSFDILDNLNLSSDTYAYYTLTLNSNGTVIDQNNLVVTSSADDYVTIDSITKVGDNYEVKIRGNYIGSSIITATWGDDNKSATCTANVIANLNVSANNNDFSVDLNDGTELILYAKSNNGKDYSTTNKNDNAKIEWRLSYDDTTLTVEDSKSLNKFNLYLISSDSTIDVTAVYHYNGNEIQGNTKINIVRNPVVGLAANTSDSTRYNQALTVNTKQENIIEGSDYVYSVFVPTNTNTFFLYENNNDILQRNLKDNNIVIEAYQNDTKLDNVEIKIDKSITTLENDDYSYLNFDIKYKTLSSEPLTDITVKVTINDSATGNIYVLTLKGLSIEPTPYSVILDANKGTFSSDQVTEYKVNDSTTTIASLSNPTRTGYTLDSWNTNADGSETSYSLDSEESLSSLFGTCDYDVTLYAQWTPKSTKITYINEGYDNFESTISYDSVSINKPDNQVDKDHLRFIGWYSSNNEDDTNRIIDANLKVINSSFINEKINNDEEITLYAKYSTVYTITFVGSKGEGEVYNSSKTVDVYNDETTIISGYEQTYTSSEGITYTLQGWYSDPDLTNKVLNANGTIYDYTYASTDGKINLTSDLTLYAKWQYQEKKDAYVLVDAFEDNGDYLIVNANSSNTNAKALGLNSKQELESTYTVAVKAGDLNINGETLNKFYIENSASTYAWHTSLKSDAETYYLNYVNNNTYYLFIERTRNGWNYTYTLSVTTKKGNNAEEKSLGNWNYQKSNYWGSTYNYISGNYDGTDRYIRYSENSGFALYSWYSSNRNIYIFKLYEDCIVETKETGTLPDGLIMNTIMELNISEESIDTYSIDDNSIDEINSSELPIEDLDTNEETDIDSNDSIDINQESEETINNALDEDNVDISNVDNDVSKDVQTYNENIEEDTLDE